MKELQSPGLTKNVSTIDVDLLENTTDQYNAWIGPFSPKYDVVTELKIAVNWAPACFSCPRSDQRYELLQAIKSTLKNRANLAI